MLKALLNRTLSYLNESNPDRVDGFRKGSTQMIKSVMEKFDEIQIFVGKNSDTDASMAFSYTASGEEGPTFLFFVDCMKLEEF